MWLRQLAASRIAVLKMIIWRVEIVVALGVASLGAITAFIIAGRILAAKNRKERLRLAVWAWALAMGVVVVSISLAGFSSLLWLGVGVVVGSLIHLLMQGKTRHL